MSERELPPSRRASTLGGVGARHRLRGGPGQPNVLRLFDGALLRGLRVLDTVHLCTRPLSPARSVLLEAAAAHLQRSDRAAGSDLTLRSHPDHRDPSRRLRKRCVRSCTGAELRHSGDVPHRGACRGRRRPSAATQIAALTAGAAGPRPGVCTPNPPAPALAVGRPAGGAGASGVLYGVK